MKQRIMVIPGDGIGPEVVAQGVRALQTMEKKMGMSLDFTWKDWGADRWLKDGVGLPKDALAEISRHDAVYFGAIGDPRIPDGAHAREILLGMRFGLDLYANVRPIKLQLPELSILKRQADVNVVIIRENTEDSYVALGGNFKRGTNDEVAIDESIHTRKGVERIIRYAFEYAQKQSYSKVTLGDKSNAIGFGGSLWQRVFWEVATEYPKITANHRYVDVLAMELVVSPELFQVIVASNLFGDILSDIGAGLVGGLGLAASGNIHPGRPGLFEPVHGSAPNIAGKNESNPLAAILSAAMMMDFLEMPQAARLLQAAVKFSLQEKITTHDIGGNANTTEVGDFICEFIKNSQASS